MGPGECRDRTGHWPGDFGPIDARVVQVAQGLMPATVGLDSALTKEAQAAMHIQDTWVAQTP